MDILMSGTEQVVVPDPVAPTYDPTATAAGVGYGSTTQGTPAGANRRLTGGKTFEDANVDKTVTKISGAVEVEMGLEDVSLDDRVRVCGEFRVIRVNHRVDKDGSIVREQVLAPLADQPLQLVPYDSTNPNDNGIVRMRP